MGRETEGRGGGEQRQLVGSANHQGNIHFSDM